MGVKMSGETMQSFNNSSRRCAHASAIFSPPGFALPELGMSREAIVFTTRYVRQQGAKAEHTVGIKNKVVYPQKSYGGSQPMGLQIRDNRQRKALTGLSQAQ